MSAAITFQVAREFSNSRLSHATCVGPRKWAAGPNGEGKEEVYGPR